MPYLSAMVLAALLGATPQDAPGRLPEPSPEAQKEAVKAIRTLFKDDYARRAAEDQVELARKLLKAGQDPAEAPPSRYACLVEARDAAAAAGDLPLALDAVDQLGRVFQVPVPALKLAVLTKAGPALKDPEALRGAASAFEALAREAVVAEDYDTAASSASRGEAIARALRHPVLSSRLAELKKDVATLKGEYQRVKPELSSAAPADADAVGRYLCFVRGDWDRGLLFLSEGGKGPLKDLAAKDLSRPESADVRIEVADGWWDAAAAERTAWKKASLLARARHWYEAALENASALPRIRVEKRLAEIDQAVPGPVDLLRLVDPKRDAVAGDWTVDAGVLLASPGPSAPRVQIPYHPPDEYDLRFVVRRTTGQDGIVLGLVLPGAQAAFVVDGQPAKNWITGLERVDGKLKDAHPFSVSGRRFVQAGKDAVVEIAVRRSSVEARIDGERVVSYSGPAARLSQRPDYAVPDAKALFLACWGGGVGFVEARLTPVSGPGKRLR